jgi:Protein of unknown function (DUF1153)
MIARIDWKQPSQDSHTWTAEFGALRLCVRPIAASSLGEFAGYIDGQRVGFWDSPEVARMQLTKVALLPPRSTTRWTARRKAEIVAAVHSGLISLNVACRRYNLTSEEFASWQRLFEKHGVPGLRVTQPHD